MGPERPNLLNPDQTLLLKKQTFIWMFKLNRNPETLVLWYRRPLDIDDDQLESVQLNQTARTQPRHETTPEDPGWVVGR